MFIQAKKGFSLNFFTFVHDISLIFDRKANFVNNNALCNNNAR